ncbi:hypothetical protein BJV82DRAFT_515722 [Fennellomyces sp. T-0311]|nr:hypothetical protein BJV82DRAFT_515722 [Fennellomyces sp. T-0311]
MERAIANGKLSVGTKLSICGAQLIGDMQPHSPLDTSSSDTLLSITTNGSRIAAWDTKLGYHPQRLVYRSLSSVHHDGGTVTALDVIVCRKYPMIYYEKLANGTRIRRTTREEEEVQRSMRVYQDGTADGWRPPFLEHGRVPVPQYDKETPTDRNVSAQFKIRICDYYHGNQMASLLLLDANELNHMDICEGSRYRIFFTMPYTLGDKSIHLKTTRKTRWETMRSIDPAKLASTLYIPRHVTAVGAVATLEAGSEVDVAALVLHSTCNEEKRLSEGRSFWHQTLMVTDASKGLCQVKLTLACRPMRNIDGQVVGFANLRYEAYDAKYSIAHLRAGDDCEIYLKQKTAPYMFQAIQGVREWMRK